MPRMPKSITLPSQMFRKRKGALRHIFDEARILLDIQSAVKEVISADIQVAALKNGELHLISGSASIATRIKYSQKSILGALRAHSLPKSVTSLKVSVRPQYEQQTAAIRTAIPPSTEAARQIRSAADHIEDANLKSALIRLSTRAKNSSH